MRKHQRTLRQAFGIVKSWVWEAVLRRFGFFRIHLPAAGEEEETTVQVTIPGTRRRVLFHIDPKTRKITYVASVEAPLAMGPRGISRMGR